VILEAGNQIVFEKKINISPQKAFWEEVELPRGIREEDLRAKLVSPANETLISYRPQKKEGAPMPDPVKPPPPPESIKSIEELYLTGLRLEQFHNPAFEPYPYYEETLRRDPGDSRVNTALGILYLKRGMFSEAEEKLSRAIRRITRNYTSPKDGEAFYYWGVALRALGRIDEAYDAFYKAAWSQAWGAASYYSLAELASQRENYSKALEFINRSLSLNALNTKALNFKTSLLRKLGMCHEAEKIARKVLDFDPLDFWAGNELYLIKSMSGNTEEAQTTKDSLETKMRNVARSYLELAVDCGNCGLVDEAVDVLSRLVESEGGESSSYPMLYYYLGYYLEKKGNTKKALECYQRASQMPADYCFPFRLESIEVLRRALNINPKDARAPYYLGNLLYDLQPEAAIKEWEKSRSLDGSFPIVHRNLGLAYARVKNDVPEAIASMEKALSFNSKDARYLYELDLLYEAGGVSPEKRLSLLDRHHETVLQRDDALSREIMLLVQLGKYDRAIDLLATHHFHVWEGGGRIHNVYVDAHLLKGHEHFTAGRFKLALRSFLAALEYPKNLEVGRPYRGGRAAQVYYFIGIVFEAMDDKEKAKEYYEDGVAMEYGVSEMSYYQGLAFRRLSQEEKAKQIFKELIDFGKHRLQAATSMDFFAKFGERQSTMRRRAQAHYLLGLGYLGRGKKDEARTQFKKSLEMNINHIWAKQQLAWLDKDREK
jgi:tetratricopeptide (TPR) repeat protein